MRSTITAVFAAVVACAASAPASAGSLQVEPVLVDITAPGAASTVTLRNEGTTPIDAQIRVFKWSIVNGKEQLNPTDDVVASPPSVTLTSKGQYVVRIVRTSKQPHHDPVGHHGRQIPPVRRDRGIQVGELRSEARLPPRRRIHPSPRLPSRVPQMMSPVGNPKWPDWPIAGSCLCGAGARKVGK